MKKCEYCGALLPEDKVKKGRRFCNNSCSAKWRVSKIGVPKMTKEQIENLREINRIAMKNRWLDDSFRENNRKRMTENNPVHMEGVKEKAIATRMKNNSYTNNFNNCGNGKISEAERVAGTVLFELGFEYNKVFGTKTLRDLYHDENYPKNYKPDFFNGDFIIEIDGDSHKYTKDIDDKKERFFEHLGIKTFRFTNDFVMNHTEEFRKEVLKICDLYQKNI